MKQNQKNGAYSIAWFKIAECVLRGEKERALGVHRLLAHSLDDQALAVQLEGDIMFACNDIERALQAYSDAAIQYSALKKYEQAAGIYEHMIFIKPTAMQFYNALLRVYIAAGIVQHIVRITVLYMTLLKDTTDAVLMKRIVEDVNAVLPLSLQTTLAEQVLAIPFLETAEVVLFEQFLVQIVLKVYLQNAEQEKIDRFIEYIRQYKPQLIEYALECSKKKI